MAASTKKRSHSKQFGNIKETFQCNESLDQKILKPHSLDTDTSSVADLEAIFKNMRLRRILKENHGGSINQMAFFASQTCTKSSSTTIESGRRASSRDESDTNNILATVGGMQSSIYDTEHCGDHIDIMSNFNLDISEEKETLKNELLTCCWIRREDDAWLAVAGTDCLIHIISLTRSLELKRLEGHKKTITDIQAHPQNNNYLLSASKDGTARLWHVDTSACLAIYDIDVNVLCFHPNGKSFLTGGFRGDLCEWTFTTEINIKDVLVPVEKNKKDARVLKKIHGDNRIDCIRYVGDNNVLSKSSNGKAEYWNPNGMEIIHTFRIQNAADNDCRFDISADGMFFCVGTSNGSAIVYNLFTGQMVVELKHRRCTKAMHCVTFSRDGRKIICAGQDSFIWRYDYIDDATLSEWTEWTKEDHR